MEKGTKGVAGLIMAVLGYLYNCLDTMIVVLVLFVIMDYILGMVDAIKNGEEFSKGIAAYGALKKVLYGFVLILGFLADYIAIYFVEKLGYNIPSESIFGTIAIAYLLAMEGLSIIKHFAGIGLPVPPAVGKFFGLLKEAAEKEGEE